MKNNQNGEFEVKVEGELQLSVESQDQSSSNIHSPKSGGNTPSDLGAINKGTHPSNVGASSSGGNLNRPSGGHHITSGVPGSTAANDSKKSTNNKHSNPSTDSTNKKITSKSNKDVKQKDINQSNKNKVANPKDTNPLLNQNKMKNFGRDNKAKTPQVNSSASFLENAKGMFNGKGILNRPKNRLGSLTTNTSSSTKKKKSIVDNFLEKKGRLDFFAIFNSLPVHIKVAIIGIGGSLLLLMVILIIVMTVETSASDGNREMKDGYINGDYTKEELCDYLERNNYINLEEEQDVKCEDTKAYQFFVNFKEVKEEYEARYERYRFQVNVELLYETLAYYHSDEEMYEVVTKEEIRNLIEAMLEEIEETCVVKTWNEVSESCNVRRYVYTLYEFSLNKYISYLKYGTTSTHPNYGNDSSNTSINGKAVTRICGEGKNVDYVFGYGLVNTSSSPLTEGSNCPDPNDKVEESDYTDSNIPVVNTTLEKLNAWGGVPKYAHIYEQ